MANEHEGHEHPALRFFVGDEELEVRTKTLTVQEILDVAGYKPASDFYLVEVRPGDQGEVKYEELGQMVELHGGEHFRARRRGKEYCYFVDGEKYELDEAHTTGAIIKSKLPEAKRGYALYLEGHGNEPDVLINDDTSVELKGKEPKRFYTVPPASFGRA
jgi:hypothetical protein